MDKPPVDVIEKRDGEEKKKISPHHPAFSVAAEDNKPWHLKRGAFTPTMKARCGLL